MLLICERHLFAGILLDQMRNRVVPDGECEDLGHRPGKIRHRQLPFPRLTDPALLGNLLDISGALARGVRVAKCNPRPQREDDYWNDQHAEQYDDQPVPFLFFRSRGRRCDA